MLQQATYTRDGRTLTATVERSDVLLQSEDILNFPRLIELEGDRLVLPYGRGRHGGSETRPVALSDNFGKTWADAPAGSPWADNVQTSGILGYLNDGSIAYIDVFPANVSWSKPEDGPYHRSSAGKVSDPVFRLRRFSRQGDLIEEGTLKLEGLPWDLGSYENYGTLLELENGDLLTAFEAQVGYPSEERFNFTTFVGRSTDGGKTFHHVHTFDPETPDGGVGDEGFCEPDMEVLANGDILCMMRTGGRSPMYQSRSTDGGHTWSEPESVGWQGVKPHLRLLSNGVRLQRWPRRVRLPTGHSRHVQHRRHRRALGIPPRLPHRPRVLLHLEHGARRQVLRSLLPLLLHPGVGHLRTALPRHRVGRHRRRGGLSTRTEQGTHWPRWTALPDSANQTEWRASAHTSTAVSQ